MASHLSTGHTGLPERPATDHVDKPEGPVAAAILASGVGAMGPGLLTTLAEASPGIKEFLTVSDPVGPLSGKTIGAVLIWLVAWAALHLVHRDEPVESRTALTVALILMALGVLGTFPTLLHAFASG